MTRDQEPVSGDWLRARRKALDLTQSELAERAGCSGEMIKRIEGGSKQPSAALRARLLACLDPGTAPLPPPAVTLSTWLRAQRAAHDLTQAQLAAALHCSLPTIKALSSGKHRPSAPLAEQIAAFFGVPGAVRPGFIHWARGVRAGAVAPPLPTAAAASSLHLPTPLTSFVGRSLEVALVVDRLRQPRVRLLTLTGPGGVGKTRVALAAGTALAADFPDGVWWVDLAPLTDPSHVAATVAAALALPQELGATPLLRLSTYLRDKRLLLIVDNCEHLPAAAPTISTLLQGAPQLKVVATSRRVLQLTGEHEYPVPPFARAPGFAAGVVFVDLAQAAGDVLAPIAAALRVGETSHTPLLEGVVGHLRDQQVLLVLENERRDAATTARLTTLQTRLAAAAPGVYVLRAAQPATTLNLLPAAETALQPPDEAVALFVARAQAVCPDWVITADEWPILTAITARLDGLPLAIELAAARSKQFPPLVLLDRLQHRLDLLTSAARDTVARQQTLRATIAWSYDLLDGALQTLFTLCAVFSGGWTTAAVVTVWQGTDAPTATRDGLDTALHDLADHSLIYRVRCADGTWRFAMLETIRDYARECLAVHPAVAGWWQRHAAYYTEQVETLSAGLQGPAQVAILGQIAGEYENLRAALAGRQAARDDLAVARLAAALWPFWQMRGYWSEGRQWLDPLAAQPHWPPALHARLAEGAGMLALQQNLAAEAETWLTASWTAYQHAADAGSTARLLMHLGSVARLQSAWALAETRLLTSRDAFAAQDDARGVAAALYNLGGVGRAQGNLPQARDYYQASLVAYRQFDDPAAIARLLLSLAVVERSLAGPAVALPLVEESLILYRQLANPAGQGAALNTLGVIMRLQDDPQRAIQLQQESLAIHRRLGNRVSMGANLLNLGDLALDRGDSAQAATYFHESQGLFAACGHHGYIVLSLIGLGDVARQQGDLAAAQQYYEQGRTLAATHQSWEELASCQWGLGLVAAQRGALQDAQRHYVASLQLWQTLGDEVGMLRSLIALAQLAVLCGEGAQAARILGGITAQYAAVASRCSPVDRAAYAALGVACAATLGDPRGASAYATGQQQGWAAAVGAAQP